MYKTVALTATIRIFNVSLVSMRPMMDYFSYLQLERCIFITIFTLFPLIFYSLCKQYFIQNTVHTNTYNNLYMTKQIQYNERDTEESH